MSGARGVRNPNRPHEGGSGGLGHSESRDRQNSITGRTGAANTKGLGCQLFGGKCRPRVGVVHTSIMHRVSRGKRRVARAARAGARGRGMGHKRK